MKEVKKLAQGRKDPITGKWRSIIAPERALRLGEIKLPKVREKLKAWDQNCPFCPGNEDKVEKPIFREWWLPSAKIWSGRVVPNKYKARCLEAEQGIKRTPKGFEYVDSWGAYEVLIETPRHNADLHLLGLREVQLIVWMYQERFQDLIKDQRIQHVLVFKNFGGPAGRSLPHPHSQIAATEGVFSRTQEEMDGWIRYNEENKGGCVFCDLIEFETKEGRMVCENQFFTLFCPFASKFACEMMIVPKEHRSCFEEAKEIEILWLGSILKEAITRMALFFGFCPPYNFYIHSLPFRREGKKERDFHWHVEIIPRLTVEGGYELGTDEHINIFPPEIVAQEFRNVRISLKHVKEPISLSNRPSPA